MTTHSTTRSYRRQRRGGLEGPRAVRVHELPALIRLLDSVFRTQGGSVASEHPYMYHPANARCLRVMVSNGVPVGHVGLRLWEVSLLGVTLKMASVGGVCTHPDFRGRGLATLLLGFLGAFTTFSSYGIQVFALLRDGEFLYAAVYAGISNLAGFLLVWAGYSLSRWLAV